MIGMEDDFAPQLSSFESWSLLLLTFLTFSTGGFIIIHQPDLWNQPDLLEVGFKQAEKQVFFCDLNSSVVYLSSQIFI